jgi:uncharacterized damage-inducible protein DinB
LDPGIQFAELLAYNADENSRWKQWFGEHPEALDLPCDVAGAGTVRKLVFHIFAAELSFGNRVLGLPRPNFENLPTGTLDELFAISEEARGKFHEFIANSTPEDWAQVDALGFGDLKASRRKIVAQAVLHSVHHRGQLATFLRQQGFKQLWIHDFILSEVME